MDSTTISTCRGLGAVSWFPVHCTSINNTNTLISGDNKGGASQIMERAARAETGKGFAPGFIAAFGQSNVGDTSPNIQGAFCGDSGTKGDTQYGAIGSMSAVCKTVWIAPRYDLGIAVSCKTANSDGQ